MHGIEESFTGEEKAMVVAVLAVFGEDDHGTTIGWIKGQIGWGLNILGSKYTR